MKPTKCPAIEKKNEAGKAKKKGEERKRKVKVAFCTCRTSQAGILHLDQKAAKCTTCKQLCGKF